MRDVEVENTEIPILMNCIGEKIIVEYPIYADFKILTTTWEADAYNLKINKNKASFERKADKFDEYREELPSYNDLIECLLASGVLKYENYDEFKQKTKFLKQLSKPVVFSPDSNNLYHRFPSSCSEIEPQNFLITSIVKNEIYSLINHKYSKNDIMEMKKNAEFNKPLFDELYNKGTKKSRKAAYLAREEFLYLKNKNARIDDYDSGRFEDKEKNDELIVKRLKEWGDKESKHVYMLTADNLMARLCEMEGVEYFQFKIPHEVNISKCDFYNFSKLIYNLACVMGVIKLNSVIVFGEYKGKSNPINLKLRFADGKLYNTFIKHVGICRRLNDIGIQK
ncbi:MAG: hypothetical protein ACTSQY_10375 [Candidatus Odinarchaeia archaeon]